MGLPSKKQLQKHRRGTRKALDTLDALSEEQQAAASDETNPSEKKNKKDKKVTNPPSSERKKSSKSSAKKKKPAKKAETVKADKKKIETTESPQVIEPAPETVEPAPVKEIEEKEKISLELPDKDNMESQTDKKVDKSSSKTTETVIVESIQDIDIEEDTQKDRFLSFRISKEDYGIEIKYVTEIIVMQKITEVPNTLPFIKGVINLRGKVIPVMDIRERFNLDLREYDDRTCVVVVDVSDTAVGLIVDTVNEVIDIPDDKIDPPPSTYSGIQSSYISGMGKVGKKVKILLDVESILNLT